MVSIFSLIYFLDSDFQEIYQLKSRSRFLLLRKYSSISCSLKELNNPIFYLGRVGRVSKKGHKDNRNTVIFIILIAIS